MDIVREQGVTRQAVILRISNGKLPATKKEGKWVITQEAFEEYEKNKYSRKFSQLNGKLIFDKNKGLHSVSEAAAILGCDIQHVYHAYRVGKLNVKKHKKNTRFTWVINIDDITAYKSVMKLGKKKVNAQKKSQKKITRGRSLSALGRRLKSVHEKTK
jgi:hypothetical protein